jgi:hypothetical protein
MECLFLLCLRAHKYTPAPVDACAEEFLMRNFMRAKNLLVVPFYAFRLGKKMTRTPAMVYFGLQLRGRTFNAYFW